MLLNKLDLFNGLNNNPIPLEFHQSMSTTKQLAALQSGINQIIDIINNLDNTSQNYTNEEIEKIMNLLNGTSALDAKFLKTNSISMDKLDITTLAQLNDRIVSYIGGIMKYVSFGLDDSGHFVAYAPTSWSEIIFSTSEIGELLLDLREE